MYILHSITFWVYAKLQSIKFGKISILHAHDLIFGLFIASMKMIAIETNVANLISEINNATFFKYSD